MKYRANVVFEVDIELDEAKFDEDFISEFRKHFFDFEDVKEHAQHLAQLQARDLLDDFTEGYGLIKNMGIKGETIDWYVEDCRPVDAALSTPHTPTGE